MFEFGGGIKLEYDAPSGTVITQLQSVSQDGNHVFEVPMFDPEKMPSSAGGFPWKADGDLRTVVYIKNETGEPRKFTAFLSWDGGGYATGITEIKPNETMAIDFREMRESQTPDQMGNIIPYNLESGQIAWSASGSEPKTLSARSEQISVNEGLASTYSCANCCQNSVTDGSVIPGSAGTVIGDTTAFMATQTETNCYNQQFTDIPVQSAFWDSSDTDVATVDGFGSADSVGVGQSDIQAEWEGVIWYNFGGGHCEMFTIPINRTAPVEVRPRITSIVPARGGVGGTTSVTINGSGFQQNATIGNMAGIVVSNVQFVSSVKITADLTISATASSGNREVRVTVGGQTSAPSNFFVQVPFFLTAVSFTQTDLGCPTELTGYGARVVYQVLDSSRQPILRAGMMPEEFVTAPQGGSTEYEPFATPPTTNSEGKFTDIPIGTCSNAPFNLCINVRQQFRIKIPTGQQGSQLFAIPTETNRLDCRDGIRATIADADNSQTFTLGNVPN